jgi:hypothetical protein
MRKPINLSLDDVSYVDEYITEAVKRLKESVANIDYDPALSIAIDLENGRYIEVYLVACLRKKVPDFKIYQIFEVDVDYYSNQILDAMESD